MDHRQFQKWLSGIDHLGTGQRKELEALLSGGSQASASLAAIAASVEKDRRCPHCGTPGAVLRGKARGLRCYQCKGCGKTLCGDRNAPVRSSPQGERTGFRNLSGRWHDGSRIGRALQACREYCVPLAASVSCAAQSRESRKLTGLVEADETCVLESRKGSGTSTARRAAGMERPESAACQMNRCRFWLLLTAAV